ncbi:hypothetical protein CRUP_002932 [Coryphaenoides rupestris]|nr:hypothetical protein CRUP_002932 [Coryphaenoides rupestris]
MCFQSKRLTVGLAIRFGCPARLFHSAAHVAPPPLAAPVALPSAAAVAPRPAAPATPHRSGDTLHLTTSTGYPYVYHNGVAYFSRPAVGPVAPPPLTYHQVYAQSPAPLWPHLEYGKM